MSNKERKCKCDNPENGDIIIHNDEGRCVVCGRQYPVWAVPSQEQYGVKCTKPSYLSRICEPDFMTGNCKYCGKEWKSEGTEVPVCKVEDTKPEELIVKISGMAKVIGEGSYCVTCKKRWESGDCGCIGYNQAIGDVLEVLKGKQKQDE